MPERQHPRALAWSVFLPLVAISAAGAIVGLQLLTTLGVTPNTALVGALVAMAIGRLARGSLSVFRSVHAQNLAQSAMSAATFGAANSLLLPMAVPYLFGRPDLVLPMFVGVALAMFLDAYLLYRLFDTAAFPASGAWPPGVAAAEAIRAGDEGGRQALLLGASVVVGATGAWLSIPMSALGTAFIGNAWALSMFGVGLLASGYSTSLFGSALSTRSIPHGIMVGAGLVALVQVARLLLATRRESPAAEGIAAGAAGPSAARVRGALGFGSLAYIGIAVCIAVGGGLTSELSPVRLAAFVAYASLAAFLHELIVGLAAMHSGWFPAFAVALITLLIGMLAGFPPTALALLVGFTVATGPAFADMGYDLKAGFILRGGGGDAAFELAGRREQWLAAVTAFATAAVVVLLVWRGYFVRDLFPPVARVYVETIRAGVAPGVGHDLLVWAIPGALLQLVGGPKRQLGVLLATGLLIANTAAGWAVLVGMAIRLGCARVPRAPSQRTLEVLAAGLIAGDALWSFGSSVVRQRQGGAK